MVAKEAADRDDAWKKQMIMDRSGTCSCRAVKLSSGCRLKQENEIKV